MKRFWVSWHDAEADYRPLTDPPYAQVLGWWCTGSDMAGRSTICALVEGEDEEDVRRALAISWPESTSADFRFLEEKTADYVIQSDRFPIKPWMIERMAINS